MWVSITLERNLGISELSRTIYTGFDFVSDVGGLSGFLLGFFAIIVSAWNFNSFENTMASHLYRVSNAPHEPGPDKTKPFTLGNSPNCKDCGRMCLPTFCFKCKCCRPSRYDKALERAREQLGQEV